MHKILIFLILTFPLTFSFQNASACTSNQFFDTTIMNCNSCPLNHTVNATSGLSCYCNANYIIGDQNQIGFEGICLPCGTNYAPSSDGYTCIKCPNTVDSRTGDCLCPSNGTYAVMDRDANGTQLSTKVCVLCDTNAFPGPITNQSITACKKCPYGMKYNQLTTPWTCECDTSQFMKAGVGCVLISVWQTLNLGTDTTYSQISYTLEDGTSFQVSSSDSLNYFFYKSAVGCISYQDPQSCQSFANLCVMQLYNPRNKICAQYTQYKFTLNGTTSDNENSYYGWHAEYPWLYYELIGDKIIKDNSFTETISFDALSQYHYLEFYVFKFAIDGSFRGSELLQTQFQLCPHSLNDGLTFRSFGISFINSCNLDISNLFNRMNNEMLFYDIYLKDRLTGKYIPIPILINDYVDSLLNTPNTGSSSNFVFMRRFFLFDNLGGLETLNSYANGGSPSVIRYAKTLSLKILLQDNTDQKIFVPYFQVDYSSQRSVSLTQTTVSFSTYYDFDTSNFYYTIRTLFILTNIAIGLIWILRVHIWTKYNPSRISPDNYNIWVILRSLVILVETWGYIIFLFLFIVTGYWFIFFKMQKNVYIFMPPLYTWTQNYYPFIACFASMCAFRIFSMLEMIYKQGKIDIFFIDWENPKYYLKTELNEDGEAVSIWRTLFIANEFNELQPYRYVNSEWSLIFLAFFLQGVNWENLAATQPYMTLDSTNVQTNFILKYFLTSFLFLVIGLVQIVGKRVLNIWIPTSVQDFVDLCSISNISIFVLDETLHGYYLHGKAPGGTAEINAEELELALEAEAKGNARSRGLEIGNPLQCYEMFIPWEMRVEYNGNYQVHLESEITYKNNLIKNADAFPIVIPKALPPGFDFKYIEEKKRTLSKLLKEYIENVVSEKDKFIRNKTYFQRLFNYPPTNMDTLEGTPIFLRDPDFGFQRIFFCGNEFSILLVDISIYEMWDIIFANTLVAVLMTYLTMRSLVYLRNWGGERNISKKTLINQRFLI